MSVHESSSVEVHDDRRGPAPTFRSAAATAPSSNRARTRSVGAGCERAIAEDVRGGEVAAARRLEDLEHRMAVVQIAERAAARRRAIDGRAERARQQRGLALRPRRAIAGHDQQAAAALDELLQRAAAAGRRKHRVVEDDDRALVEARPASRAAVVTSDLERRRRADRRAPSTETGSRRRDRRCRRSRATPARSARARSERRCRRAADRCRRVTLPRTFGAGQRELRER